MLSRYRTGGKVRARHVLHGMITSGLLLGPPVFAEALSSVSTGLSSSTRSVL